MDGEDGGFEDQDVVMSVFLTGLPTLCQDYHQGSLFPPNPLLSMYCKKYKNIQTKKKNQAEFIIIFQFLPSSNVFPPNLKRVNVSPPNRPLVVNGKRQRAEIFPLTPQFQFPLL